MKIGRSISTQIAAHAALKTGVHAVGASYLAKTSQADQTLSDTEIPAAIMRDAEHVAAHVGARAYHDAAQVIPNTTHTALAFNSERYDTDTIHDLVTNNSRLTCKTAGKYLIGGCISFENIDDTRISELYIRFNGATIIAHAFRAVGATANVGQLVSCIYDLAVNDYVELVAYHSAGADRNLLAAANFSPEFWMTRLNE